MHFHIGHTWVRFHPLMLLLLPLAALLGMREALWPLAFALSLHEIAHLAAARVMGVRVTELLLMPFGGAAQMGNLYALSPGILLAIAAAGPAANLVLAVTASALAQWGWLSTSLACQMAEVNLALMLFNLLPALPLDGGRMLYAMTVRRLGRVRAARLGIAMGRGLSAALLGLMAWGYIMTRRLNLSLAACAVFILSSAAEERRALADLGAATLLNALERGDAPVEMRLCAVNADCPARTALRRAAPEAATLYAVYRDHGMCGFVDERQLIGVAMQSPEARVNDAMA